MHCKAGSNIWLDGSNITHADQMQFFQHFTSLDGVFIAEDNSNIVMFCANVLDSLSAKVGSAIIFQNVTTNNGDHYNPNTGTFTCPDNRIYLFQWSLLFRLGGGEVQLMRNEEPVKEGPKTPMSTLDGVLGWARSGTSSTQAVVQCVQNTEIWVRLTTNERGSPLGEETVFMGFAIGL